MSDKVGKQQQPQQQEQGTNNNCSQWCPDPPPEQHLKHYNYRDLKRTNPNFSETSPTSPATYQVNILSDLQPYP